MSKGIETPKEKLKRHDLHKPEQNVLLDNSPEQIAKKVKDTITKDDRSVKSKGKEHGKQPNFIRMTPLWDNSTATASGDKSDRTKPNKSVEKLFKLEDKTEHELTAEEMKTLIPKLAQDVQQLQTFCFTTINTIASGDIKSTAEAVALAKEQADLKLKGKQPTLASTDDKQKALLAELHSPKMIAAFNDLANGINNNYLPAYMQTPRQAWDEGQQRLPKTATLLNLVNDELMQQKTTAASLCRLLTRTLFVSSQLDHLLDELDRITCNDRSGKTKEDFEKERKNEAEYRKALELPEYQLSVINRNKEIADICDDISKTCWDFKWKLYNDNDDLDKLRQEKLQITHLIDNFYKLYSSEQMDKDCQDAKLTDKQRSDIASLKEAIGIILPFMESLRDDCQTGQILNKKRYKVADFTGAWTNQRVADWKYGQWVNSPAPVNKLDSDSFYKKMEMDDIGRRFQH